MAYASITMTTIQFNSTHQISLRKIFCIHKVLSITKWMLRYKSLFASAIMKQRLNLINYNKKCKIISVKVETYSTNIATMSCVSVLSNEKKFYADESGLHSLHKKKYLICLPQQRSPNRMVSLGQTDRTTSSLGTTTILFASRQAD